MSKLLNLLEWASETYSKPPSLSTLRRWVREGKIYPAPELHGKEYKLHPGSVYVNPRKPVRKPNLSAVSIRGGNTLLEKLKRGETA